MTALRIYTDGGAKGNPGPASIGIAFYLNNTLIDTYREDIGSTTNNVAEYTAIIRALERAKELIAKRTHRVDKINCFSDASLLVNQLNGLFKVKNARIRELVFKIRNLEQEIPFPISYSHIPREENTVADKLVNNKFTKL